MPGLALASIGDIAAMKAAAIGGRGSAKDFFDLYHIFKLTEYNTSIMINDLFAKFGKNTNFSYIAMGLNYFGDAKEDELPETFVHYDWDEIKRFFCSVQKEFIRKMKSHSMIHE